jgi:hypothetical protein
MGVRKGIVVLWVCIIAAVSFAGEIVWNFDNVAVGDVPSAWKVESGRANDGVPQQVPEEWKIVADATCPSTPNGVSRTTSNNTDGGSYQMFWTDSVKVKDCELSVRIKTTGGAYPNVGLMMRAQDNEHFLGPRVKTNDKNLCIYIFHLPEGERTELGCMDGMPIAENEWFELKGVVNGETITAFVNGEEKMVKTSNAITTAGGIGVFCKGDNTVVFDNITLVSDEISTVSVRNAGQPFALMCASMPAANSTFDCMGRNVAGIGDQIPTGVLIGAVKLQTGTRLQKFVSAN